MKNLIYCTLIVLTITSMISCNRKYYMSNMVGEDDIDVTYWIVKKRYKPLYCENKIYKLINPSPKVLNSHEIDTIANLAEYWVLENNINLDLNLKDSISKLLTYSYSYMLYYSPIDVYVVKLSNRDTIHNLYIRYDKKIILPLKKDGWIISSCE